MKLHRSLSKLSCIPIRLNGFDFYFPFINSTYIFQIIKYLQKASPLTTVRLVHIQYSAQEDVVLMQ